MIIKDDNLDTRKVDNFSSISILRIVLANLSSFLILKG